MLALVGSPTIAQQATGVRVTLSNFTFAPTAVRVPLDQRVRLTMVNAAKGGHNFAAAAFFGAARIDPVDAAEVVKGIVDVPEKSRVTIALKIDRPGRYKPECSHFLHATFGMSGAFIVE